ncbi:MAG: hypothetical protein AAGE89_02400 [Pseudomonadota bacterium]
MSNRHKAIVFIVLLALVAGIPSLLFPDKYHRSMFSIGSHIEEIAALPGREFPKYRGVDLDLGYKHPRFGFFWLPLGGSAEGNYVLYTKRFRRNVRVIPISRDKAEQFANSVGVSLPAGSPVAGQSFYWGWWIFGPLVLLVVADSARPTKKQKA